MVYKIFYLLEVHKKKGLKCFENSKNGDFNFNFLFKFLPMEKNLVFQKNNGKISMILASGSSKKKLISIFLAKVIALIIMLIKIYN